MQETTGAQVLRLKGWMLVRQGRGEEAEVQLRASIDCAPRVSIRTTSNTQRRSLEKLS